MKKHGLKTLQKKYYKKMTHNQAQQNYFKTKNIFLVGASEGIGKNLAIELANLGANVAIGARNIDKLNEILPQLIGKNNLAVKIDVTDLTSVESSFADVKKHFGNIDILIFNAGFYEPMGAKNFSLEPALNMIETNLNGGFRVVNCALPDMLKNNFGEIILVASVAGYCGLPNAIGYGASKAGLIHFAENLKCDLSDTNIKIKVVNPGFVKTRLTDKNSFKMPFIITPEKAAEYIISGITSEKFDINFPKRFTLILRFLRLLPYSLYFKIAKNFK
jgi:short-subunit dehydrogenase